MPTDARLSDAKAPRLLLVEDDAVLRRYLVQCFLVRHYQVTAAGSVAEALMALRVEPLPDVVLLDWLLPDGTGAVIASTLRTTAPDAVLVVLTGWTLEDVVCPEAKIVIEKPVPVEQLAVDIACWLAAR